MGIESFGRRVKFHAERLLPDYLPALQERKATERIPPVCEAALSPEQTDVFLDTIIKPEQLKRLSDTLLEYEDGTHHFREQAGTPEDGTRHPHDFIAVKEGDRIKLFFVDPEHSVGKSKNRNFAQLPRVGDLRPRVNVLYATELTGGVIEKVSLIRYRSDAIPDNQKELHKPSAQLSMAYLLLDTGELPEALADKENEITFRFDLRRDEEDRNSSYVLMQARSAEYASEISDMIESYSTGENLPKNDPLEGQMNRYRSIMRTHFPRHLEDGLEKN